MTSVSATELAKLGKCEALVTRRKSVQKIAKGKQGFRASRAAVGKKNRAAIERGEAAHDKFEQEAQFFTSQVCNNRTKTPEIALALALAAGLLALIAAATA